MQNRLAWSSSSLSNASTGRGDEKTHDCEANHQNQNVDIDDKGALLMNASKVQASINVHTIGTTSHGALDLVRQLVLAVALLQAGYSIPRYFMIHDVANLANRSAPFQVTVAGDVILDFALNQPLIDPPTIPSELLLWTSLRIPLLAIVLVVGCIGNSSLQKRISSTVTAFWGLCTAIALSEGATCCFKMYIARRRPNFYALCGFDLVLRACTASTEHIREAQCSFPSGHSSLAAVSMVYLSWYLTLRILPSNSMSSRWQTLGSLSISIILPGYAVFVGATRLADNWHHFSDVLAGLVLGSIVATIVYFHFQPSLFQCSQFDKE